MKLTEEELALIQELRAVNPARNIPSYTKATTGQLFADRVTRLLGSWPFLLIQTVILVLWVAFNIIAWAQRLDPYPFILLNLALSFQAAYAAPIILMSQNREEPDRSAEARILLSRQSQERAGARTAAPQAR